MGLFDLPAPLWSWVDTQMALILPAAARIVAWGAIAAVISLGLYWLLSPQQRIAHMVATEQRLKSALRDDTIETADGLGVAKDLLKLALARLGLVTLPVLVATLPLISLMTWMEAKYAYDLPGPGQSAEISVEPESFQARWIPRNAAPARVDVLDDRGSLLQSVAISAPVPVIEKRLWWNALIGNPLGYLPDNGPVNRVDIQLPTKEYFPVGPAWIRGWLAPFILSLLAGTLLLKFLFRIY